jgi:hypothetical protein
MNTYFKNNISKMNGIFWYRMFKFIILNKFREIINNLVADFLHNIRGKLMNYISYEILNYIISRYDFKIFILLFTNYTSKFNKNRSFFCLLEALCNYAYNNLVVRMDYFNNFICFLFISISLYKFSGGEFIIINLEFSCVLIEILKLYITFIYVLRVVSLFIMYGKDIKKNHPLIYNVLVLLFVVALALIFFNFLFNLNYLLNIIMKALAEIITEFIYKICSHIFIKGGPGAPSGGPAPGGGAPSGGPGPGGGAPGPGGPGGPPPGPPGGSQEEFSENKAGQKKKRRAANEIENYPGWKAFYESHPREDFKKLDGTIVKEPDKKYKKRLHDAFFQQLKRDEEKKKFENREPTAEEAKKMADRRAAKRESQRKYRARQRAQKGS